MDSLAPFEEYLGIHIEEASAGRAVLSMPFLVKLAQGKGLLHGGAVTSLADTAVAMAIKTVLPEGSHFATTELSLAFHAPVRSGQSGRWQPLSRGTKGPYEEWLKFLMTVGSKLPLSIPPSG